MLAFTVLVFCNVLAVSYGYPGGAGTPACADSNMMPLHNKTAALTTASPFTVTASSTTYKSGDKIQGKYHRQDSFIIGIG